MKIEAVRKVFKRNIVLAAQRDTLAKALEDVMRRVNVGKPVPVAVKQAANVALELYTVSMAQDWLRITQMLDQAERSEKPKAKKHGQP